MKEVWMFTGIVSLLIFPILWLVIRKIFKGSFISNVGGLILAVQCFIGIECFVIGKLGLVHLSWVFPTGSVALLFTYFYMYRHMQKPMARITKGLDELAAGNLVIEVDNKALMRKDEVGRISNAMKIMLQNLCEIVTNLKKAADKVSTNSGLITEKSLEVSDGVTNQAASIEEIAASVEEITAGMQLTSQNADHANNFVAMASSEIDVGAEHTKKTVTLMGEISEQMSSIRSIADQTNLLALNAAVESSRAGEHGKGFAVVAKEIRVLAERSRELSDSINELTEQCYSNSKKSGENMDKVLPGINKTNGLVKEIAAASNEQKLGAEQINDSVQIMNHITQVNASSAELLSKIAAEMNIIAKQMNKSAQFFKTEADAA